jgi:hypothetical protein
MKAVVPQSLQVDVYLSTRLPFPELKPAHAALLVWKVVLARNFLDNRVMMFHHSVGAISIRARTLPETYKSKTSGLGERARVLVCFRVARAFIQGQFTSLKDRFKVFA